MWSPLVRRLLLWLVFHFIIVHTHNTFLEGPFLCACTLFISDPSHVCMYVCMYVFRSLKYKTFLNEKLSNE